MKAWQSLCLASLGLTSLLPHPGVLLSGNLFPLSPLLGWFLVPFHVEQSSPADEVSSENGLSLFPTVKRSGFDWPETRDCQETNRNKFNYLVNRPLAPSVQKAACICQGELCPVMGDSVRRETRKQQWSEADPSY